MERPERGQRGSETLEARARDGSDKGRELRGTEGKRSIFWGACKEVGIYEEHLS